MADNFISGNDGAVTLGSTEYSFKKWTIPIEGGTRRFFAFGSDFQRTLPGGKSAQVVLEGAYNQGNMPLTIGAVVTVTLVWTTLISIGLSARISNIEFSNEIGQGGEPGGQCKVTLDSEGSFTITFS